MLNGMVLSAAPVLAKPARKPSKKLAREPGPTPYKPAKNSFLLKTNEKEEVKNKETLSNALAYWVL
jgi:hypothetical protein